MKQLSLPVGWYAKFIAIPRVAAPVALGEMKTEAIIELKTPTVDKTAEILWTESSASLTIEDKEGKKRTITSARRDQASICLQPPRAAARIRNDSRSSTFEQEQTMWGISSIVDAVQDVADDVIDVASDVVDKAQDANPLSSVFDVMGLNKVTDAVQVMGGSALDEMFGIVRNGIEGIDGIGTGVGEIFKGDFKEGFKDIGVGLFDITIGSKADASLFFAAKSVEAIQGFAGIEGPARGLTDVEKQELRKVYGDSIDYDRVVIREGDAPLNWGAARTIGNTIYIPSDKLPLSQSLLTHEMGHVWQFQNGGTDYMREALWAQAFGDVIRLRKRRHGRQVLRRIESRAAG